MEENFFEEDLYYVLGQNLNIPKNFTNSILTFDSKMKKRTNIKLYKKFALAFSFLIISINIIVCAYKISENYKSKNSIGYVNNSLKSAVENGYIQNIDMEYAYSNNVGAKIDYIIMSDYNLNILFDFDISQVKGVNREGHIQDLLIYDENNNIIFCYNNNVYKKFCKKNNIKYIKDCSEVQYTDGYGVQLIELSDSNNKTLYTIRSVKGFPKSKKLYVLFNSICFDMESIIKGKSKIKGNWNLELNLSEQFYDRDTIKYRLKEQSNDIELITANSTTTTMRITYKMKNINISEISNISMYIKDTLGNKYDVNNIEDSISVYKDEISATFPITIKDNLEEFILYISLDKNNYIPILFEKM